MKAQQLDLTVFGQVGSSWVEKSIEKTGKDGVKRHKGSTFSLPKRAVLAEETGLVGKANKEALDDHIMDVQQHAWNQILAELVKEGPAIGLKNLRTEILANGEESISIKLRRLPIKVIKAEDIAKAWGISIEEAREIIKSKCKIASPVTVDVPAAKVPQVEDKVPTDNLPADTSKAEEQAVEETVGTGMTDEELEKLTAPANA